MNDRELLERYRQIIEEIKNIAFKDDAAKGKVKNLLDMFIRNRFGEKSHYLETLEGSKFSTWPFSFYFKLDSPDDKDNWEKAKREWINLVETMMEEIQSFSSSKTLPEPKNNKNGQRIFVVHGHDNEMVETVARFIIKLGFEPIILREQPNQGRTIIEKFEDYADVPFAIVLFSPDDFGKATDEDSLKPRPRQNVVFELGFFIGKLGRDKVVVLHKVVENFEMLSDFQGVIFEPYKDGWEFKIAKEIKAAGFEVDLNNLAK